MFPALAGGVLIGLAATLYWLATGRVAGVSGLLRGALREGPARSDSVLFLLGLVGAGVVASLVRAQAAALSRPLPLLLGAGLLVGFGTRVGGRLLERVRQGSAGHTGVPGKSHRAHRLRR